MKIFNLFNLSPSRHLVNQSTFKSFTYCDSCTRRDSKLCHKFCNKHNKYYWSNKGTEKCEEEKKMIEKEKIEELIAQELEEANNKYPLFHSPHEAYAVLAEEVDELFFEVQCVKAYLGSMWECVKTDGDIEYITNDIRWRAVMAAQEAIQVAAMCDKVKQSGLYENANNCKSVQKIV